MKSGYGKHGKVKNAGEDRTALGVYYRFWLKAEIGNRLFVGTADGGDDEIEVGLGHSRAERQAESAVE